MDTSIVHIFIHRWKPWQRFPAQGKQTGWIKRCKEAHCTKYKFKPLTGHFRWFSGRIVR